MGQSLDILMVLDLPQAGPSFVAASTVKGEDYKHEVNVANALRRLGHSVRFLGIWDDIDPLIQTLKNNPPDLVFVMCESIAGRRGNEDHVVGILEMYGIPYTGGSSQNLGMCRDKALTKKIVSYHGLRVPRFAVFPRKTSSLREPADLIFPAICKPIGLEASEGISLVSLVKNKEEMEARIRFLHEKYDSDVIVEEFIEGDEYYVGVIGNDRLTAFMPQILKYKRWPKGKPQIFSYKAKWDNVYRKRWGIDSATARNLDPLVVKRLQKFSKDVYRSLGLTGYARMDLRMDRSGEPVLIEANPNPGIARHDDFALSAYHAGCSYDDLISRIVRLGLRRAFEQAEKSVA